MAPHLGGGAGGRRIRSPASAGSGTSWRCRPWRRCLARAGAGRGRRRDARGARLRRRCRSRPPGAAAAGIDAAGADALLVTALANVRYLTGFSGSAGALLVTGRARSLLVTDGRYRTQAGEQLTGAGLAEAVDVVVGGAEAQRDAVAAGCSPVPASADWGSRPDHVTWSSQRRWADDLASVELVPPRQWSRPCVR